MRKSGKIKAKTATVSRRRRRCSLDVWLLRFRSHAAAIPPAAGRGGAREGTRRRPSIICLASGSGSGRAAAPAPSPPPQPLATPGRAICRLSRTSCRGRKLLRPSPPPLPPACPQTCARRYAATAADRRRRRAPPLRPSPPFRSSAGGFFIYPRAPPPNSVSSKPQRQVPDSSRHRHSAHPLCKKRKLTSKQLGGGDRDLPTARDPAEIDRRAARPQTPIASGISVRASRGLGGTRL